MAATPLMILANNHRFRTSHSLILGVILSLVLTAVSAKDYGSFAPPSEEKTPLQTSYGDFCRNHSIENTVDVNEDPLLVEMRDFDAAELEEKLMRGAVANLVSPAVFHQDLKNMINGCRKRSVHETMACEKELKQIYNFSSNSKELDPGTVTKLRVTLMYPQDSEELYDPAENSKKGETQCPFLNMLIPMRMRHPNFGGLIPRDPEKIDRYPVGQITWTQMIWAHLTWLTCYSQEEDTLDNIVARLKQRMEKSLLTDEQRIQILQKNHLIKTSDLYIQFNDMYYNMPQILKDSFKKISFGTLKLYTVM